LWFNMNELAIKILEDAVYTRQHCLKYSASPDKEPEKLQKQIDDLEEAILKLKQ